MVKEPKVFLPRLFLNIAWSVFLVMAGRALISMDRELMISLVIWGFPLVLLDLLASAMYPVMVRDYHRGGVSISRALREATSKYPGLLVLYTFFTLLGLPSVLVSTYLLLVKLPVLAFASLVLLSLPVVLLFYYSPTAYVLGSGLFESLGRSVREFRRKTGETVVAVLVSGVFFLMGVLGDSLLGSVGLAGFVTVRALKTVSSTYTSLLAPEIYLEG